jgi:hypothetical protein
MDTTMKTFTNLLQATNNRASVNQFIFKNHGISADDKEVITLNVDTMYALAFLKVINQSLVFYKPETDRFCSV